MGKTVTASTAAAVAIILLSLCHSSYGKDAVVPSLHSNNDERRSLRRGMAVATNQKKSNGIEEEEANTQQSVKFHTKLSEAVPSMKQNKRVTLNNKFYDMSGLTEKEVSSEREIVYNILCASFQLQST